MYGVIHKPCRLDMVLLGERGGGVQIITLFKFPIPWIYEVEYKTLKIPLLYPVHLDRAFNL